jgi:hypothetical protein
MAATSTIISVDFSNVKESSGINPKNQPEGDYAMRIIKAEVGKTKNNDPMVILLFQDSNLRSAVYPYYCTLADNMLWKIRNAFIAAGLPVPKSKGKLDVAKLVNKEVGVSLEDDEYEGKPKSVISAVFHKDELEPIESEDDDELEDDEPEVEEEEEEEEAPAPKARKAKAKPAPVVEEDDEDDEDDEEEEVVIEAAPPKRKAKAKPAPVVEEDDDEDDDDLELDDV